MAVLIWIGAGLTVVGLLGIVYSMIIVAQAKRANLPDEEMRAKLAKILPINLGTLFVAMIGLMMVIVGLMLS